MREVLLIELADDLTGANADASLLVSDAGVSTLVAIDPIFISHIEEVLGKRSYNAIVVSTNSRELPHSEAYEKCRAALLKLVNKYRPQLFAKRIDTTLRGNIGSEINSFLDTVKSIDFVVLTPAYPDASRIVVNDKLYVGGKLLEDTEAARELRVKTSIVSNIIREQTTYPVHHLDVNMISTGWYRVANEMEKLVKISRRSIIVADAKSNSDLENIARAISELYGKGYNPLVASPGPLTALTAKFIAEKTGRTLEEKSYAKLSITPIPGKRIILAVVGSITNLTFRQMNRVLKAFNSSIITLNPQSLIVNPEAEIERCIRELFSALVRGSEVIIVSVSRETILTDYKERKLISTALGKIVKGFIKKSISNICGMYLSGGDTAVSVLHELGEGVIEVLDKPAPLTAFGLTLGDLKIPVITKGGLVGEEDAAVKCVEYLRARCT
jgi:uncharacterized protein YgbK (DUF1537 family)